MPGDHLPTQQKVKILDLLTSRHRTGHQCLRHEYQITPQKVAATHLSLPGLLRDPGIPLVSSASLTTGSLTTSLCVSAAVSPRASLSSLFLCVINSPFLQSRACPKLNWVPQPSQLEGILRRSRQNHNEYLGTQQQTGQTGGVLCPFHPLLSWLPVCSWCPSALELPLASFGFAPSSVSLGLPLLLLYHYDYHYYYLLYHYYYYHYY